MHAFNFSFFSASTKDIASFRGYIAARSKSSSLSQENEAAITNSPPIVHISLCKMSKRPQNTPASVPSVRPSIRYFALAAICFSLGALWSRCLCSWEATNPAVSAQAKVSNLNMHSLATRAEKVSSQLKPTSEISGSDSCASHLSDPAFRAFLIEKGMANVYFLRTSDDPGPPELDACCIASMVEQNPHANVMLFSNNITCERAAKMHPNLRVVRYSFEDAFADTPALARWYESGM